MDMKKLSIYALAAFSMIGTLGAESLSLITGENGEVTEKFDWNDTSKWTPTVSEVAGNDLKLGLFHYDGSDVDNQCRLYCGRCCCKRKTKRAIGG